MQVSPALLSHSVLQFVIKEIDIKPDTLELVEREIGILSEANHPYIVSYKECFALGPNEVCLVMEYCSGGDLGKVIDKQKAKLMKSGIDEKQIVDWTLQIGLALEVSCEFVWIGTGSKLLFCLNWRWT